MQPMHEKDVARASDDELIRRWCGTPPDLAAREEVCRRCLERIKAIARKKAFAGLCPEWMPAADFAEEITSEAALNFVKGISSYRYEGLSSWIRQIVENTAVTLLRRETGRGSQRRRPVPIEVPDQETPEDTHERHEGPLVVQSPQQELDMVLLLEKIRNEYFAQSTANAICNAVIERKNEGYSSKEIGKTIGRTPGAVDQIYSRDLVKYRKLFGAYGISLSTTVVHEGELR